MMAARRHFAMSEIAADELTVGYHSAFLQPSIVRVRRCLQNDRRFVEPMLLLQSVFSTAFTVDGRVQSCV